MHEGGEIEPLAGPQERKPQDLQIKFWSRISEPEPVLGYIQDLEVRLRLFEELGPHAVKDLERPNVAVFSAFMVAPITKLEEIVHHVQRLAGANDKFGLGCVLGTLHYLALEGIQAFANKGGYQFRSTSSSVHDSPVPSPGPNAFYIFPLHATKHPHFLQLQHMLTTYWNSNEADMWCNLIEYTNTLESFQNFIRLDPQLHWYYNNGEMALKPLRKNDDGSVVVQFHWLKRHHVTPSTSLQGVDIDEWMQRAGLADNSTWGTNTSGIPIETGQTFVLGANDPAHVPSFELLQLSWDLLRFMAISGVATLEDWSDYGGSDGDIYHEAESGIWNEDDYARMQSWASGIQTDEELENNPESSN